MGNEPWNEPNTDGEKPGDICCLRSMGGRCYEHNPKNYPEACFCRGKEHPHLRGAAFVGPGNLMCRGPITHTEFKTYTPSAQGLDHMRAISQEFDALLTSLDEKLEPSRELSLVRTHLEIACFYARKGKAKQTASPPERDATAGVCEHGHARAYRDCRVCFPAAWPSPYQGRGIALEPANGGKGLDFVDCGVCGKKRVATDSNGRQWEIGERFTGDGRPTEFAYTPHVCLGPGSASGVETKVSTLPPFNNANWEALLRPPAPSNCEACKGAIDGVAVRVRGTQELYHKACVSEHPLEPAT